MATWLVNLLDQRIYGQFGKNWDDALFRNRILPCVNSDSLLLDLGAGAGILDAMNFRGVAKLVCGVDLDPRVTSNPMLDEGIVGNAESIPYPDASFDLVFADNLLEHLAEPGKVFSEVNRVLKTGGLFLFKTPNKSHYVPLIASLTPQAFHQWVNKVRGRAAEDTFPTLYRVNTRTDVQRFAAEAGFVVDKIELIEGRPEYLRMFWPTYLLGAAYEKVVNSTEWLAPFRVVILGQLRKAASA